MFAVVLRSQRDFRIEEISFLFQQKREKSKLMEKLRAAKKDAENDET